MATILPLHKAQFLYRMPCNLCFSVILLIYSFLRGVSQKCSYCITVGVMRYQFVSSPAKMVSTFICFILYSLSAFGQWGPLYAGSCVLLTCPYHSLRTLLSDTKDSPSPFCIFPTPLLEFAFFKTL